MATATKPTARELTGHLWRGGPFAHWWGLSQDGETKESHWFEADKPESPSKAWGNRHQYFSVHPGTVKGSKSQRVTNATVAAINCLFGDFDAKDEVLPDEYAPFLPGDFDSLKPAEQKQAIKAAQVTAMMLDLPKYKARALAKIRLCPLAPTWTIDTGGGYQCFWLLADTVLVDDGNRDRLKALQGAWAEFTGADSGAKDLARVLRLPGSANVKAHFAPNYPIVTVIERDDTRLYSLVDFEGLTGIDDAWQKAQAAQAAQPAKPRQPTSDRVIDKFNSTVSIVDVLTRNGYRIAKTYKDTTRLVRPGGTSQSVTVWNHANRSFHHSSSDPLHGNDHGWDAYDVFKVLEHNGDYNAAFIAAKKAVGLWDADIGGAQAFAAMNGKTAYAHAPHTNGNGTGPHTTTNGTGPAAASNGSGPNAGSAGQQSAPAGSGAATSAPTQNLYFISGGKTWYNRPKELSDGSIDYKPTPIASFTATITTEIVDEAGTKHYVIEGQTSRGGKFTTQIAAESMSDDRKLRAVLEAAAGPLETVFARMGAHLSPAIRLLTNQVEHLRRFDRTGWNGAKFLIPGREPSGTEIALPEKLPYNLAPGFDVQIGLAALADLMEVIPSRKAAVILSHVLVPPLAELAGLDNERGGLNIEGGTGRFKTSTVQQYMSIWGAKFGDDDSLLKWGEGVTTNAATKYATHAHDMPFLIDNFKPNTGGGEKAFVGLIHNIMEGGEKERLDRNAQLRAGKPISCWPIVTGEDLPRNDSATLARMLVVQYENVGDCDTEILTRLQDNNKHLPAIGAMWLDWLESPDGHKAAQDAGKRFTGIRKQWAGFLAKRAPGAVNPYRIASNLAVNELAFVVAAQHPQFGSILGQYSRQHIVGLEEIALGMGRETSESQEAQRFLAGLQELIASGRALLLDLNLGIPTNPSDRDRHIGWKETDDSLYLLPTIARQMIERHTGQRFNSAHQIHRQLDELGLIQSKSKDGVLKVVRIPGAGGKRVLHLSKDAMEPQP